MITSAELKSIVHYDPDTGVFTAVVNRSKAKAGRPVGTLLSNGYLHIQIRGKFYKGHRLAWFYMMGEWPAEQVDHINGCRSDNRWSNLRPCSNAQNSLNRRKYRNNSSSVTGVYWIKRSQRWAASIDIRGTRVSLGNFNVLADAATARRDAEKKYFGEFARAAA